jgi:hypothetical protein
MERRMLLMLKELAEGTSPPDWLLWLAAAGWGLGAAALGWTLARRKRWISLAASLAAAAFVWFTTGDFEGAVAAYMGLGLALLCVALFRWWALLAVVGLGVLTWFVLAFAVDAWIVFGLVFGTVAVGAGVLGLRRQRLMPVLRAAPG